ncbi:MAG TPA: nucleoside triphosphate pyrophosphohydrolase [Firmicutes bacterium]|nr:nucleoside triphosphate pyrophosphohydrolase [Bacillota bacterium]
MKWQNLVEIIEKLRSPRGCPWDRQQTHESLKPYLLEEAYELLEAIDNKEPGSILDELGDVLLQVLLHAQIAKEAGEFTIDDVIENLSKKMIRRHPHVFAAEEAATPAEVAVHWEEIKKKEKKGEARKSVLDGVPKVFPALMRADKIQKKAANVGFDWEKATDVLDKLQEELDEVKEAFAQGDKLKFREELGDLFFAAVNVARFNDLPPELILEEATAKFIRRFQFLEKRLQKKNLSLENMTLAEMDEFWEEAKSYLAKRPQA